VDDGAGVYVSQVKTRLCNEGQSSVLHELTSEATLLAEMVAGVSCYSSTLVPLACVSCLPAAIMIDMRVMCLFVLVRL
jgi:hypothetical protein